jgi:hypothetical protein
LVKWFDGDDFMDVSVVGVASAKADTVRWRSLDLSITALSNRDDVRLFELEKVTDAEDVADLRGSSVRLTVTESVEW